MVAWEPGVWAWGCDVAKIKVSIDEETDLVYLARVFGLFFFIKI